MKRVSEFLTVLLSFIMPVARFRVAPSENALYSHLLHDGKAQSRFSLPDGYKDLVAMMRKRVSSFIQKLRRMFEEMHAVPRVAIALAVLITTHIVFNNFLLAGSLGGVSMAIDVPTVFSGRPIDSAIGTTINIDFSKELTLQHESEVPLLTLLSKLKTQKTETVEFKFAIGRFAPRLSTENGGGVGAGAVDATAALTVAAGNYFTEGDVIEVPDTYDDATHSSQLYVQSILGNVLTVRAYETATYGVSQIDAGSVVRRISSGMIEGSSGRSSSQTVPTVYNQYSASFEDYFDVTTIQDANRNYTGPERTRLREEARKRHAVDQEYALFLMKKTKDTKNTKPRYQFDGLLAQIKTNVLNYGASLSDDELYDFMTDVHSPMYSGGNKRMVLCSADILTQVNKMARDAIRITTRDTTWGPNITEVQCAGKVWQWIESPTLSESRSGWAAVVHPNYMRMRTLIPTRYEMNVQNPIDKFYKDGFYTVMAPEIRLEEVFGLIRP